MLQPLRLFFIAGEASGDLHTANLVRELKKIRPDIRCVGLGGPRMRAAGVEILFELTQLAAVGFVDVVKKYHKFHDAFHDALDQVKALRPTAVVLTDFPGFNLRFAKEVKQLGIPVVYYISPQVWAWKKDRINSIPKIVDKMLVILPFEKNIYTDPAMQVEFVGHPLVDEVKPSKDREALKKEFGLASYKTVISLLPGSRKGEVTKILPIMAKTAALLSTRMPGCMFLVAKTAGLDQAMYNCVLRKATFAYKFVEGRVYDCFSVSDFALVKSGTSTLEATIIGVPYVLIYHVSLLTYLIGRLCVTIPYLGIANIIAGKKIIEEFIQHDAEPEKIAAFVHATLSDQKKIAEIKKELKAVKTTISTPHASRNAAQAVLDLIDK
jgi:lipid-A-disaccharide synthase